MTHRQPPSFRRPRFAASLARRARWEFWSPWLVYLPMFPYACWLAARYGLTTCTLANPRFPLGGLVGESKWDILSAIPRWAVVPSALIPPGPPVARATQLESVRTGQAWGWPIVLKPDVGERGTNVRVIRDQAAAAIYLAQHPEPVLAQRYHPGPYEVGIFYARPPGATVGTIFSITDKRFAVLTANGASTLREQIWRHPRYRLQAEIYLANLGPAADDIPAAGTPIRLGELGNHCRGALFLDGASLITPELTRAVDAIAAATPGFAFGRFDVRYAHPDDLAQGRNLAVVELNGLLSESTNIYDPAMPYWRAQAIIRAQWKLACEIGAARRREGLTPPTARAVWSAIMRHTRGHAT